MITTTEQHNQAYELRKQLDLMEFRVRQVRKILKEHEEFAARLVTEDTKLYYLNRGIDLALEEMDKK